MELAAEIALAVFTAVGVLVVLALFVWAASEDGREDRALHERLGIRRKTRIGR